MTERKGVLWRFLAGNLRRDKAPRDLQLTCSPPSKSSLGASVTQGQEKGEKERKRRNTSGEENEEERQGRGGLAFFHSPPPPSLSSHRLSQKRKEIRKVPSAINQNVPFLISHRSTFFKQAVCDPGKVLFSQLCDFQLKTLILLISSESLPHHPPPRQTGTLSRTGTHLPGRGGEGRGDVERAFPLSPLSGRGGKKGQVPGKALSRGGEQIRTDV